MPFLYVSSPGPMKQGQCLPIVRFRLKPLVVWTFIFFELMGLGIPSETLAQQAPGGVTSNLTLWLRADAGTSTTANGGNIATWSDQSTSALNASQATGAHQPQYFNQVGKQANFNPVITFDGSDDHFRLPSGFANFTAGLNAFSIHQFTNNSSFVRIFELANGAPANNIALSRNATNTYLAGYTFTGNVLSNLINGPAGSLFQTTHGLAELNIGSGNAGVSVAGQLFLNGVQSGTATIPVPDNITRTSNFIARSNWGSDGFFGGNQSELILYNRQLTASEQQRVNSYLAIKYGLTMPTSMTSYVASNGTAIWANGAYWKNVAGIGRDDASGLDQKQSASINTDNELTIGLGTLAATNITNPNSFTADRSFLVWGAKDETAPAADIPTNVDSRLTRMNREWRVQKTGVVGNVTVRVTNLPVSATKVWLLRDADGNFTSGATATDVTSAYSNGVLSLSAIDFADGEVFTVGYLMPAPGGVLPNLTLWLRADTGVTSTTAGSVQTWLNQAEKPKNALTGVGAVSTVSGIMNFNPVLRFNGNSDLRVPGFSVTKQDNQFAAFAVHNSTVNGTLWGSPGVANANNKGFEWGFSNPNSYVGAQFSQYFFNTTNPAFIDGSPDISNATRTGPNSAQFFANGAGLSLIITNPGSPVEFTDNGIQAIGSRNGDLFFNGDIPELIVYNTAITVQQRKQIQSYLALKYGITLDPSVNSYLLSDGTTLWNNLDYWKNIAGIIRDDASVLTFYI
jgi:hypothetical protein